MLEIRENSRLNFSPYFSKRTAVPSPVNIGQNPLFKAYHPSSLVRFQNAKKPANIGLARFATKFPPAGVRTLSFRKPASARNYPHLPTYFFPGQVGIACDSLLCQVGIACDSLR